jgi:translation initiation factor IF-3
VRLIDGDGNQVGIVAVSKALEIAALAEMDLVEVAPAANPPVCRVMDFGKFRFEQNKKLKEAKKKQKSVVVKEVKFRPKIDSHDFITKVKMIDKFLGMNCRVKVTIMFRGREMAYQNRGRDILDRVIETIGPDMVTVEQTIKTEGRNMHMTIAPKPSYKSIYAKDGDEELMDVMAELVNDLDLDMDMDDDLDMGDDDLDMGSEDISEDPTEDSIDSAEVDENKVS